MRLITKTHKEMLKRLNYLFNKKVQRIELSTGVKIEIVNNVVNVL